MSIVSSNISKVKIFFSQRPMLKGMVAYSVIWPTGSIIQQTIEGKTWSTYDWKRCIQFGIFGALYVAPSLYGWVRFTSVMWPQTNFRAGITKALVDQVSYGPFSITSFYIGMTLLEFKTLGEAIDEWKKKFFTTFKVGVCVWPVLQTINFSLIPEGNRVVFVSICSLLWTTYLAYMKHLDQIGKNPMLTE